MSIIYQAYLGKITIGGSTKDFSINPDATGVEALALTAGDYYPSGYAGEGGQLVEHMQTVIRTVAEVPDSTVTLDLTTGLVTIEFLDGATPVSTDMAWTDGDLQTLLGFTGSQTGAASYTATNSIKGYWSPSLSFSEAPDRVNDGADFWGVESTTVAAAAPDGTTYTAQGAAKYSGTYGYSMLDDDEVIGSSSTVWHSLKKFWAWVVHTGKPLRVVLDRSTYAAATDYAEAIWTGPDGMVGSFHDAIAAKHVQNYDGFWDVTFRLLKKV